MHNDFVQREEVRRQYDCPICHGFGLLRNAGYSGRENGAIGEIQGSVVPYTPYLRCPCTVTFAREQLLRWSGLTGDLMRLDDLWPIEWRVEAVDAAKVLCKSWTGMLTLVGPFGVGKTVILKAIAAEAVEARKRVALRTLGSLLNVLRSATHSEDRGALEEHLDMLLKVRVLLIDELDKWYATDWARDQVFQLLDSRYRDAGSLATVVAYNDKTQVPPYLLSRLSQFPVVSIDGADLRPVVEASEEF